MSRKSEGKRHMRAELETIALAMVSIEEKLPIVVLRINQAIRRADLGPLLGPAISDLEQMAKAVSEVKSQAAQAAQAASQFEER